MWQSGYVSITHCKWTSEIGHQEGVDRSLVCCPQSRSVIAARQFCEISKLYKVSGRTDALWSMSMSMLYVIVITCDVFWWAQMDISDSQNNGMTYHPMLFDDLNTLLFWPLWSFLYPINLTILLLLLLKLHQKHWIDRSIKHQTREHWKRWSGYRYDCGVWCEDKR